MDKKQAKKQKGANVDVSVDDKTKTQAEETKETKEAAAEVTEEAAEPEADEEKDTPAQGEIDRLSKEIEELKDKDLRRQAEFENFRKRNEKEKAQQFDAGAAHVLEHILPVIDNFERGFSAVDEEDRNDAFVDGMNKVYKQLMTELEKLGVTPIEAVGEEFDPNRHNAVMQVDTGEVAPGCVAQEMQKGYLYHDTVLRFSMVAVQE